MEAIPTIVVLLVLYWFYTGEWDIRNKKRKKWNS